MERIDPKKVLPLLNAEHTHRYVWAARGARGRVLDAACGVGYGAPLLLANGKVSDYTGIDSSLDAIDYARRDFGGERTSFLQGDIYKLPFVEATFDSIVSLETIEHLDHPGKALAEFARVLKPDGVLLGSVPLADFETKCIEAYGPNEYHKSLFTIESLRKLLLSHFPHMAFWNCWLSISSVLAPLNSAHNAALLEDGASWGSPLGSLLFAATRASVSTPDMGDVRIFPAVALVEHELKTLTPRETAIRNQTRMINDRDATVKSMEARLEARRLENLAQSKLVDDRDAALKKQTAMIQDRDAAIAAQAKLVDERNIAITRLTTELQTARTTLPQLGDVQKQLAKAIDELSQTREALTAMIAARTSITAERDELSRSFAAKAAALQEHEMLVKAQSDLIEKRTAFIKHLETLIVARDAAIVSQTRMIDERVALIASQDKMIEERNIAMKAQAKLIDERDSHIRSQNALIGERDALISDQQAAIASIESRLKETGALAASFQVTIASQGATINMLEQRLASLGGSLSMVRHELRQHLSEMQSPRYCLLQATRAAFRLGRNGHSNGEGGQA